MAGTDPLNATSVFVVLKITRENATTVRLTWSSVAGKQYEVLSSPDLLTPFTNLSGPTPVPAAGASTSCDDSTATGARRFYEVRVQAP